jgi:N-glycosylase/DNA lyase
VFVKRVEALKAEVGEIVGARIKEFESQKSDDQLFSELCFCILTANFDAEKSIAIQREIGDGFLNLPEGDLAGKLKRLGHRFPNARASYIVEARGVTPLSGVIGSIEGDMELRDWLVEHVRGVGYKEASHFLRNIGRKDLAILDFHIIDLLSREGIIKRPKSLTKRSYLEIEDLLRRVGEKLGLDLAELDHYLWFMETGKVLK